MLLLKLKHTEKEFKTKAAFMQKQNGGRLAGLTMALLENSRAHEFQKSVCIKTGPVH